MGLEGTEDLWSIPGLGLWMSYLYKSISCIDNAVWTLPPSSSGPLPRHTTQKKIKSQGWNAQFFTHWSRAYSVDRSVRVHGIETRIRHYGVYVVRCSDKCFGKPTKGTKRVKIGGKNGNVNLMGGGNFGSNCQYYLTPNVDQKTSSFP